MDLPDLPLSVSRTYGVPVDLERDDILHAAFLRLVTEQVEAMFDAHERERSTPAPTFVVTDGVGPPAFATVTKDGRRFVGVTLGKAVGLLRYFQCALTHPSSLTEGMLEVVGSGPVVLPGRAESYREEHVPTDVRLHNLAEGLARFALMFVAGHELGHIAHGHLVTAPDGTAQWDEETEATRDPANVAQAAREMAADRYGGTTLASYLISLPRGGMPASLLVHNAQLAVYSLFLVEQRREDWVRTFFQHRHPPVQFRQVAGAASLDMAVVHSGLLQLQEVMTLTGLSMERALKLYEAVTGTARRREDGLEFARFARVQGNIVQVLLDEHRRLYPTSSSAL